MNIETLNALTTPTADIKTEEDGEVRNMKLNDLCHPKRKEIRRYDAGERLRME